MAMVPVQELLEQQERREAEHDQQSHRHEIADGLEGSGDHVEERTADQRSGRQRNQREQDPLQCGLAEHQRDRTDERDRAHQYSAENDPQEFVHFSPLRRRRDTLRYRRH